MSTMFTVWCPENGQEEHDGKAVLGHDAEDAAKRWADWYDYNYSDYTIVGGQPQEVCVRERNSDMPTKTFSVYGESARVYYAREKV